jgi:hypothetical protein
MWSGLSLPEGVLQPAYARHAVSPPVPGEAPVNRAFRDPGDPRLGVPVILILKRPAEGECGSRLGVRPV